MRENNALRLADAAAIDRNVLATGCSCQAKWARRVHSSKRSAALKRRFSTSCTMQDRVGLRQHEERGTTVPIAKWSKCERRFRVKVLDPKNIDDGPMVYCRLVRTGSPVGRVFVASSQPASPTGNTPEHCPAALGEAGSTNRQYSAGL